MKKIKLQINLNKLLHDCDISLTQLHIKTGIRLAALSELANGKRQRIQLEHLEKIIEALHIEDMNEVFSIVEEDEAEYDVTSQKKNQENSINDNKKKTKNDKE